MSTTGFGDVFGLGGADKAVRTEYDFNDPNYEENRKQALQYQREVRSRTAPTIGAAQATGAAIGTEGQGYQSDLAGKLKMASEGRGPSAAQDQFQSGLDQSLKAQQAFAASRPMGGSGALGARMAVNAGAGMQADAATKAAILRAQEQQQAMAQYGQLASAMRSQDLATAAENNKINLANAGFLQQASLANQQAQLSQTGLDDAQMRALLAAQYGLDQQRVDNWIAANQLSNQDYAQQIAETTANKDRRAKFMGSVMNTAGSAMMAMSDETAKADIKPGDEKLRDLFEKIGAHDYVYKDPEARGAGHGRFVSPMAQEIEKSELGRDAVVVGEDGKKRVDYARLFGAMLSGESYLHRRISKLEDALAKVAKGKKV